jgi:hypothetical protein
MIQISFIIGHTHHQPHALLRSRYCGIEYFKYHLFLLLFLRHHMGWQQLKRRFLHRWLVHYTRLQYGSHAKYQHAD